MTESAGRYDPEIQRKEIERGARQDSYGTRFADHRLSPNASLPLPRTLSELEKQYIVGKVDDVLADMPRLSDKEGEAKKEELKRRVEEGIKTGTLEEWKIVKQYFEEEWSRRDIDPSQKGEGSRPGGIRGFIRSLFSS